MIIIIIIIIINDKKIKHKNSGKLKEKIREASEGDIITRKKNRW